MAHAEEYVMQASQIEKRDSRVEESLRRLDKQISTVADTAEVLLQRLDRVLRASDARAEVVRGMDTPTDATSPLAADLDRMRDQLERVERNLNDAISRLEL